MPDLAPPGTVIAFAGRAIPAGWEICDGREVSKTDARYVNLYNAIQTTWGGNDNPNFKLPDLRGQFLMGASTTADVSNGGGTSMHDHGGWTSDAFARSDGYKVNDDRRSPQASGLAHQHSIGSVNHLPPFRQLIYLIKL
jgi:hypothetical protein